MQLLVNNQLHKNQNLGKKVVKIPSGMANSIDSDQTAPMSTVSASIANNKSNVYHRHHIYAPNFESSWGANCFWLVCSFVRYVRLFICLFVRHAFWCIA